MKAMSYETAVVHRTGVYANVNDAYVEDGDGGYSCLLTCSSPISLDPGDVFITNSYSKSVDLGDVFITNSYSKSVANLFIILDLAAKTWAKLFLFYICNGVHFKKCATHLQKSTN